MRIPILIPHFREGRITAYSVSQFLKYKNNQEIDIIVINNSYPDDSIKYLEPFKDRITIIDRVSDDKIQSHGVAIDLAVNLIDCDYFITAESDSFPTRDYWLDYYLNLIHQGYDAAASHLDLSGGTYLHPCGGLYKRSIWEECKEYCESIPYDYFPNMARRDSFDYHLMVHRSISEQFLEAPEDYVDLADNYKPYTKEKAIERLNYYHPITMPFHNGMGGRQEHIDTYGKRTLDSDSPFAILKPKSQKLIFRVGAEPGQYLSYWLTAMNKKVFYVPTEVVWVPGREHENQEYTLMESGIKHLWGISSYKDSNPDSDWIRRKQAWPVELYATLPEEQKIRS